MKYVPVIMTNGSLNIFTMLDSRTPTLGWLQKQVVGYIETVPVCLGDSLVMIVNEDGYPLGLPINDTATDLQLVREVNILGNVVILRCQGSELVPLTLDELKMISAFCASSRIETREIEIDEEDENEGED